MKLFFIVILVIASQVRSSGQSIAIDSDSVKISKRLQKKKSTLVFSDSTQLKSDILHFERMSKFISKNIDSVNSFFVWSSNLFLIKNRLAVTYEGIRNEFDSIALSFIYEKFLNYQFKSKRRKLNEKKTYEITLVMILSFERKSLHIEILEPYKLNLFEKRYYFHEFMY